MSFEPLRPKVDRAIDESVPPLAAPWHQRLREATYDYFFGEDPTLAVALVPLCFLSMLLFTRHPFQTNFIFDEQEALLANPYVRAVADPHSTIRWIDAFHRDFWGLLPERTIGSYRPIPDVVWRSLWAVGARDASPFLHHWVNVLFHGLNGAIVCVLMVRWTRDRLAAWLAGALFVACAVLTEAVSGVVGIADVLGALGVLLALWALALPAWIMPVAVFVATLFGLYSKESALACVPLVPVCALFTSQMMHPTRPWRFFRAFLALIATAGAFVLYVEARRRMFPAHLPTEFSVEANAAKPPAARAFATALRWFAQPMLPRDPLNNPLVETTPPYRIAGALRVYLRGLGQIVFPRTLSGDYSAQQEPIPQKLFSPETVAGAAALLLPLIVAPFLALAGWLSARRRGRAETVEAELSRTSMPLELTRRRDVDLRPLVAFALVWVVVSYLPVSNIPVLLPTVRAERFWYTPAVGTSILLALVFTKFFNWTRPRGLTFIPIAVFVAFVGFQSYAARRHANDYKDDLSFWRATRFAVPRSAKAHLNYSVMLGARKDLQGRLDANRIALEIAPNWPMANVYLGDTLCRMQRVPEAWPHYERGFELAPNDVNLIALGVQCMWDEKALAPGTPLRDSLEAAGKRHPGSWLDYLARDVIDNGESHKGVDPKYRPRGYNEGPKQE